MECRQRYPNLRVSGSKSEKEETTKTIMTKFAEMNGVKIEPKQIIETRELRGRNSEKYNPLLVRFVDEKTRDRFIDAKFASITKCKAVEQEIERLQQSENPINTAEAERKRKKEPEPLRRVRISEDLTPRRQSLLTLVKNTPGVKNAYTRGVYLKISNNETYNFFTLMIVLYVDDTAIIADSKENLQRGLNALMLYYEMWKLQINTDKRKSLYLKREKSKESNPVFTLNNNPIELVESFNYLGVVLSSN